MIAHHILSRDDYSKVVSGDSFEQVQSELVRRTKLPDNDDSRIEAGRYVYEIEVFEDET